MYKRQPVGLAWWRGSHGDAVLLGAKPPDRITHDVHQSLVEVEEMCIRDSPGGFLQIQN